MHRFITLSALLISWNSWFPLENTKSWKKSTKSPLKMQNCIKPRRGFDAEKLELESPEQRAGKKHGILTEDLSNLDRSYKETLRQYEEIKENHQILKDQYDALLKLSERESTLLGKELDAARLELQRKKTNSTDWQ